MKEMEERCNQVQERQKVWPFVVFLDAHRRYFAAFEPGAGGRGFRGRQVQ